MIDNIKNRNIQRNTKNQDTRTSPAMQKLDDFTRQIESSDFKNSFSRYSIELKLINSALSEASNQANEATLKSLNERKAKVIEALKQMGYTIKE